MATFVPKPIKTIKNASIQVGWIDTGAHPGYEGRPNTTGITIAEVARMNTFSRDFVTWFDESYLSRNIKFPLLKDITLAIKTGRFEGELTSEYLMSGLIETITQVDWPANTEEWLKFKAARGLSLEPLVASQTMLNSISARVVTR